VPSFIEIDRNVKRDRSGLARSYSGPTSFVSLGTAFLAAAEDALDLFERTLNVDVSGGEKQLVLSGLQWRCCAFRGVAGLVQAAD
jgi:hypothetical protein